MCDAMRLVLRLSANLLLVLALTALAVTVSAVWFVLHPPSQTADVIIVLGGDMTDDNSLGSQTRRRVETGVALFEAGAAPRIHFTGGLEGNGRPAPAEQMRELAVSLGVPAAATSVETLSQSTLQNALFSRPVLGPLADGPVMIVTDGFHLARAWASFRWDGYGPVRLAAATAFGDQPIARQIYWTAREAAAWWLNLARASMFEVIVLLRGPEAAPVEMLR
jgi:uncharacterized SAM-binding protein YcdF (DUF218 family)